MLVTLTRDRVPYAQLLLTEREREKPWWDVMYACVPSTGEVEADVICGFSSLPSEFQTELQRRLVPEV